jgi:hypothetical protein
MPHQQSRKLKPSDLVGFDRDANDTGTVQTTNSMYMRINWDDGHRYETSSEGGPDMTGEKSRCLKSGDRVWWNKDDGDRGTVFDNTWSGVTVKWDNLGLQAILHNDMGQIEQAPRK